MTNLEIAMMAGAYAIKHSQFYRKGKCFADDIPFVEAAEVLCKTADEQNVFTCPVEPGQFVYCVSGKKILVMEIEEVHFTRGGDWWASFFDDCYDTDLTAADKELWMSSVFPTLELAEKKLKEMQQ